MGSRSRIGKALGRNVRQSVVTILSAEGVHQDFKAVLRQTEELRRLWVIQRMSQCEGPAPVPERLALGKLDYLPLPSEDEGDPEDLYSGASTTGDEGVTAVKKGVKLPERLRKRRKDLPRKKRGLRRRN